MLEHVFPGRNGTWELYLHGFFAGIGTQVRKNLVFKHLARLLPSPTDQFERVYSHSVEIIWGLFITLRSGYSYNLIISNRTNSCGALDGLRVPFVFILKVFFLEGFGAGHCRHLLVLLPLPVHPHRNNLVSGHLARLLLFFFLVTLLFLCLHVVDLLFLPLLRDVGELLVLVSLANDAAGALNARR
jgi:hypothetical protein